MWFLRFLTSIFGAALILIGLLGSGSWIHAIIDPRGLKAADDNDPFGIPPSRLETSIWLVIFLLVGAAGVYLTWKFSRRRQQSV